MAAFHSIRDEAIRAVDAVMSESVRLFPMASGRADPGREQAEFNGVLRVGNAKDQNAAGDGGSSWGQRISFGEAQLHFDRSIGPLVKKGDRIRAIERENMPWFDVLSVNERQHGRIVLALGEA